MRVLVAMSGGVDSSLAAARLLDEGHEVVGATLKLWGGAGDSGCCSLADVTDARRVADSLSIEHHVFSYEELFERAVVSPFVASAVTGRTTNPCVSCNKEVKFGELLRRAGRLGFDKVATGHHAQLREGDGGVELWRGADRQKDQSYVLSVLERPALAEVLLPVGSMTKEEVRAEARRRSLRTADKPDSQDLCFIPPHAGARAGFLASRAELHPGTLLDHRSGERLGEVEALETLTVGQRRGVGVALGERRFVTAIDARSATVRLGLAEDLLCEGVELEQQSWTGTPPPPDTSIEVQVSAHGSPRAARLVPGGVRFLRPERVVAPGQIVAIYEGARVLGSGVACGVLRVEEPTR